MFKKIEIWILYLLILIFFISLILFGGFLKYSASGGKKLQNLQIVANYISNIPLNFIKILRATNDPGNHFVDKSMKNIKEKNGFTFFKNNEMLKNKLLILSRYDGDKKKGVVEIVDLDTFKIIHRYEPDSKSLLKNLSNDYKTKYPTTEIDLSKNRMFLWHPYIEENGNLIFNSSSPLFNIDICNRVNWVIDKYFHHSLEKNFENNYWATNVVLSKINDKYIGKKSSDWSDDGVVKVSSNGEILYEKSFSEILIENNYQNLIFTHLQNPINNDFCHLNDVQPTFNNTLYWKKDDVFLSCRNLSTIFHFRPSTGKIINVIQSSLISGQHDVDIIDNKTISIFNNESFHTTNGFELINQVSSIVHYSFDTKEFKKMHSKILENSNFGTRFGGLIQYLNDKSFIVEEQEHGRILYIDNKDELIWSYINKANNGKVYVLRWSSIVEDEDKAFKIKKIINEKKCIN